MAALSPAAQLIAAVLVEEALDQEAALALIDTALALEVDPLAYCIHRFALCEAVVFERAAMWAGLAFYPDVPRQLVKMEEFARIDTLGEVRRLRARVFDRDFLFCAPRMHDLLRLVRHLQHQPEGRNRVCIVPPSAIVTALAAASSDLLLTESRQRLARRWPFATAHLDLPWRARLGFVVLVMGVTASAVTPLVSSLLFLPASIGLLLAPAILRLAAVGWRAPEVEDGPMLEDEDLPVYTILIPLRDEAGMVPLLVRAMRALDYPREKLDIKFVVEAGSVDTVAAVRAILPLGPFELIAVPDAAPRTKPKALNYALPFVRGEHIVVYDAEDIPAPDQLRRAASRFAAEPEMACLQAVLTIDNAAENPLTALFASEYAGLFGVMLPALARWGLPMPLGGTSNHFRTQVLKDVGSWDAFNVTEDADLGVRLARLHHKTGILASATREEAPVGMGGWMKQRTRWMKGWMQTFIVHNSDPRQFLKDTGWKGFIAFEIYIGGIILAPLLHTLFLVVALVVRGLLLAGQKRLLVYQFLLPLYWILHSVATVRAMAELLYRPYFWAKTVHGKTKLERK